MAKNKKATKPDAGTDEATQAGAEQSAEKAAKAPKKAVIFKFTGTEPTCKLAPQAAGIVNILKEAGDTGLSRDDLVAAMEGVITSKQPLSRILAYYQKLLVESEAVEIVDAE
jgi:hypothetical protein